MVSAEQLNKRREKTPAHYLTWLWLLTGGLLSSFIIVALLFFAKPELRFSYTAEQLVSGTTQVSFINFYKPQADAAGNTYVWTQANSAIEFNEAVPRIFNLEITARSAAVAGGNPAPVQVIANGRNIGQFQPDPARADFQLFTLKVTRSESDLGFTRPLKLELVAQTFQAPNDPRTLGTMVKAITIDKSESWSGIERRLFLFWLLPVIVGLAALLYWLANRYNQALPRYSAAGVSAIGSGFMLIAFVLLARAGTVDVRVQNWWTAGAILLAFYFSLITLQLITGHSLIFVFMQAIKFVWRYLKVIANAFVSRSVYVYRNYRRNGGVKGLYRSTQSWLVEFKDVAISSDQALAEFYRYRIVNLVVLGLGIIVTISWSITVMPGDWLIAWLAFLALSFGAILFLTWHQLHQGNSFYKLHSETVEEVKPRSNRRLLWLSLGGLFVVSLVFTLWVSSLRAQWIIWDSAFYYGAAHQAVKKYIPDAVRPSGYAVLVSYFIRLFGSNFVGQFYFFQAVINSLNAVLVFAVARLITKRFSIAWVAGLLCALCPFTAAYSGSILTETMAVFFMTTTVYLTVLVITRPNIRLYYVLLGLSSMLLLEIRYNFQLYVFVPLGLILLFTPLRLKVRLQNTALVIGMSLVILLPAAAANYNTFNKVIIFTKADNFSYSLMLATYYNHGHWFTDFDDNADRTLTLVGAKYPYAFSHLGCEWTNCPEDELGRQQLKGFLGEYFSKYGGEFAARSVSHLWDELNQTYIYPYSLPLPDYFSYEILTENLNRFYILFLLTGLWYLRSYRLAIIPILSVLLYLWLLQAIFPIEPRYMLPIYPVMLIIVAIGLMKILDHTRQAYGYVTRRNLAKPRPKWIILPVFNLCLIILLTNLVNSNTYKNTYGLQMGAISSSFGSLDLDYYKPYLPQFINSIEGMKNLPETTQPINNAALNTYLARTYLRAKNYNKAMEAANTAILNNPAGFEAYHWRSRVWEELGQLEKAQMDQTKFKELVPKNQLSIGELRY